MTMQPFVVERLDHIVLRVRDLERSIAFYRDVLGCVVVKWRDDLELAHLRLGTSMLDLVAVSGALGRKGGAAPGGEGRNLDHFCVRIEPFDEAALVAHLEGFGLVPQVPAEIRFGAEGDGWSLYFFDPDGNRVELKGPRVDNPA
ncbi:VOC family protein [Pseudomonas aeruginosa]|nr:VOC family protein [Pseudomonas aeruginosa]MED5477599.1 VOC family protein [Pseudomonadota bacterium]AOX26756.1 ring-cleaving dioxygenase [Pseudomonas aeruginosa]AOX33054.1 ring-cleaving dioxygenase [Pseudomonas aeruginosa]AOX39619.1 ring-cleaving dioxygenase [Pseudomonas aeruginosa]APB57136.1 ring-cleaving dioxygenase [Pseudomonas aeruginosa]